MVKFKKALLVLPITLMLLVGCAETYVQEQVQGTVIEKEYDPSEWTHKTITDIDGEKTKVPVYKEEEYEVTIQYENIIREFEFEDSTFYEQVNVGDTVNITLVKGLDSEGNIVSRSIDLPGVEYSSN